MSKYINIPTISPRAIRAIEMVCVITAARAPIRARDIARLASISDAEVHDFAVKLKGIVTSIRGRDGGYVSANPELTVGDVLGALKETMITGESIHASRFLTAMNRISRIKIEDLVEED